MAVSYVALFRGINVGPAKRVRMADLRALLEELGYRDVRTMLNSGNALFTTPALGPEDAAAQIEAAFARRFGFDSRTVVLTAPELAAAVEENPLLEVATALARLYVAVPADATARRKLRPLLAQSWRPEELAVGTRVAYLWCPDGVIASRLPGAVQEALGDAVTMRSWRTMVRLAAAAAGAAEA